MVIQYQKFPLCQMTGYEEKTTFWNDFTIADAFGKSAIQDTFNRAFSEWKTSLEYVTELVLVLNWKMWQHSDNGNIEFGRLYEKLWRKTDNWCMKNLKGDELNYYLRTID